VWSCLSPDDEVSAGLQEALTTVEGGDADGIVVAKVDRLSRWLLNFTTLIERSRP
jgi:DNA invertase Pin-like site-specific DNA recombinase